MRKLTIVLLLFVSCSSVYGAPVRLRRQLQQRQQRVQQNLRSNAPNPVRPNAQRRIVQDAVLGFYITQFRQVGEVSPDVFAKVVPFFEDFVQDRFEISERRQRALNQLRQAVNRNAEEEELRRLVRDLDNADAEFQANQERFFNNVDPLLSPLQQAKVRILQNMADNRIRQILNNIQNPAQRGQGVQRKE